MTYNLKEIEERIIAFLDENEEILRERTEYADPGTSLPTLIRMVFADVAREYLLTVEASRINEPSATDLSSAGVTHLSDTCATIELPAKLLRLLHIRMSDWTYGLGTFLQEGSEEHLLRRRGHCRGSQRRRAPAACIVHRGGKPLLEVFGTGRGSQIAEIAGVMTPEILDEIVEIPSALFHDICMKTAETIKTILLYD